MGKVIHMESTINLLGKKNPKDTQKLIESGKVTHGETSYLVHEDTPKEYRTTLDGQPLNELNEPMALIVNTKVPSKWILQDTETGEIYRGTTNTEIGKQWEKIITVDGNV